MKALLLCSGSNSRFAPLDKLMPKCMMTVRKNVTLLENWINYLTFYGVKDIWINLHLFPTMIIEHVLTLRRKYKFNVNFSYEEESLGSGGGILSSWVDGFINENENFFVFYSDAMMNIDLEKLMKFHKSHGKIVTMTVRHVDAHNSGIVKAGIFGRVKNIAERPPVKMAGWSNCGFYTMNGRILNHIADDKLPCDLMTDIFPDMLKQIRVFKTSEPFIDLGTLDAYITYIAENEMEL